MRALLEAGITPDLVVGSSVGALNGAFLATHPGAADTAALEEAWGALGRKEIFRFAPTAALAGFLGLRNHIVPTKRFRGVIERWLGSKRIEDCPVRFVAVATDMLSGEPVVL